MGRSWARRHTSTALMSSSRNCQSATLDTNVFHSSQCTMETRRSLSYEPVGDGMLMCFCTKARVLPPNMDAARELITLVEGKGVGGGEGKVTDVNRKFRRQEFWR